MTETRTFLGMTIEGDINYGVEPKEQYPQEELGPYIQKVLDHPKIDAVRWSQFTPYFNDGEPCIFHAQEPSFKVVGIVYIADSYEDEYLTCYDREFKVVFGSYKWDPVYNNRVFSEDADREFYADCFALSNVLTSGHFDVALLKLFGDHATVTVDGKTIEVEFYEHD